MKDDFAIGIDFGTTKSALAYVRMVSHDEQPAPRAIQLSSAGSEFMPSEVYLDPSCTPKVGMDAELSVNDPRFDPKGLFMGFKLDLGYPLTSLREEYQRFAVKPVQLAYLVIRELKEIAERGELKAAAPLTKVTITVPSSWTDQQKSETMAAAYAAGFRVVHLIREPYAALVSLRPDAREVSRGTQRYAVLDYGGGTCDIAICTTHNGILISSEPEIVEHTVAPCGGLNIDNAILDYCLEEAEKEWNIDLRSSARYRIYGRRRIQKAKEDFSDGCNKKPGGQHTLRVAFRHAKRRELFRRDLSLSDFERLVEPEVRRAVNGLHHALKKANVELEDLNKVYLIGGSSLLPLTRKILEQAVVRKDIVELPERPRHHVVYGAAMWAYHAARVTPGSRHQIQNAALTRYNTLQLQLQNRPQVLVKKGTPLTEACKHKRMTLITPHENMLQIRFSVIEGDQGGEIYAERTLKLAKPVAKGTKISIEYYVDAQDILVLKAFLADDVRQEINIIGGTSVSQQMIEETQKRWL